MATVCAALLVLALAGVPALPSATASAGKGKPLVSTGGVSHVRGTSVELDGSVDPHGLVTEYWFVYGPSEQYGFQTPPQTLEAKNEHIKVGVAIASLAVGDHYRLVARNSAGGRSGRDKKYGKSGALTFSLSKTLVPILYRHGLTISGKLVGTNDERVPVTLQETPYPFLEGFADVGTATQTGAGGVFSFHLPSLSTSAKFRVVAKQPRPLYSPILTQSVTPAVVLRVRKTSVQGLVRLYGTITPAETGARVLLQVDERARPGNSEKLSERNSRFVTEFSTISRRGRSSFSRFSVIATVRRAGEYRAYVQLRRGRLDSAGSETVMLAAAKSKRESR